MTIHLYDTLTRSKRAFEPQDRNRVTLYACGPTVYSRAHIGNARPAVVFGLLASLLRHKYGDDSVVYARNITDVDDKINAAARTQNVPISSISEKFERHYVEDMGAIGVAVPDLSPHATAHIPHMIEMISKLLERGHAYEANGHVLFHVPSDPDYGMLSRRDSEAIREGARVEVAPYKKDPSDFVLWKPADGAVGWESPWGRGRPGWHIECSAMIKAHLGETIDIHAGGLDLIFPHHENEMAQSRCTHSAPLARYWLHNGFLAMGGEKMSKSAGGIVTVAQLLEQGYRGEVIRLALLSAHYRQPLDWTDALLHQSKARLDALYRRVRAATADAAPDQDVINALRDDLNTPLALARMATIEDASILLATGRLLGLLTAEPESWFHGDGEAEAIEEAIQRRTQARTNRNWAEADRIRDELMQQGITLEDGPNGTTWCRSSGGIQ